MDISSKEYVKIIEPFVHEIHTDVMGNIIAHKHGDGKSIMLIAHHDVVCLMITHIDNNGFLYAKPAGGIEASILPARKIVIKHNEKDIIGIIGRKPVHLVRETLNGKVTYDSLWIDIGAKSQSEAMTMVDIGDYAYFCPEFVELPNGIIAGAYFDDNIGLRVLQQVAERIVADQLSWDIFFVASNHEEIGMRGARVAAHVINPDVCIVIDVTHATDYPTMNPISDGNIRLGEGCVLAKSPNVHSDLIKALKDTATRHGLQFQIEANPYPTGTDANVIQLSGDGVKTAVLSIPCRYMHTPYEVCSKKDIESTIMLLTEYLKQTAGNE